MRVLPLIRSSLRHYLGLHALVIAGVAVAVAVLAGALLVGSSVRVSLRDIALARLGATELVVSSTGFFRAALAGEITAAGVSAAVPILAVTGAVTHEGSRRTAARVQVFGIDDRFLAFHGRESGAPTVRDAWISPGLAAELGASPDDIVLLRISKPTDIPHSTVQGRRDDVSERVRLRAARVIDRAALGEFSLLPAQGPALSIFVPLARLQQDLELDDQANALLVRMATVSADADDDVAAVRKALTEAARLDDLGLKVRVDQGRNTSILESRTGLLPEAVSAAAARSAEQQNRATVGVLTYLANSIRADGRDIPYSLITAMDLDAYNGLAPPPDPSRRGNAPASDSPAATAAMSGAASQSVSAHPPMWLNEWAAADLAVRAGDRIEVDYYVWSDVDGLQTRAAAFTFVGVVPMTGAGGDATLTPEYPGITDAGDVSSWDPPFPVEMNRVRKKDEDYWDTWRSAPKAFIPLEVGQQLWPSPFGTLSSLRAARADAQWPSIGALDIFASGLSVRHARAESLAAAEGTTDFGEYFVYFSFFLVVSGLLLAGLFFALSVEQRATELGLLLAVGFAARDVRRVLVTEAAVLATAGSVIGMAAAIGYAALIMYGLRTWWVGAVGTTALELHIDPLLLLTGAAGAFIAAIAALALSFRRLASRSARTLLTSGLSGDSVAASGLGGKTVPPSAPPSRSASRAGLVARYITVGAVVLAAVLIVGASLGAIDQVAAFFGAGGLILIAGCAGFAVWLRRPSPRSYTRSTLLRFGAAYAGWRPTRSVLSAALIAFACFVIVAVGAFRRDQAGASLARDTGTGGFVLMAEAVAPLMHNPNTAAGREEMALAEYPLLENAHTARFRLRPGDEASCLTLYQPKNPRIIAPEPALVAEDRFAFAASLAETDEERANPWLLLNRTFDDGAVPTIADQTSLTYVFHLQLGDDFVLTPEGGAAVRLRVVATLADSVLQSELIIGENNFIRLFPQHEGYRIWMIEAPESDAAALTALLEDSLSDFGVDVVDTRARLAAYHQVENTYLSTFQALGALGLLLGTVGLAAVLARNVLERRRELGVLGAIGFTQQHLRTMVTAESLLLVSTGSILGTVAALLAVAPALAARAGERPWGSLALLLLAVIATGLVSSFAAVRFTSAVPVVQAIKNE